MNRFLKYILPNYLLFFMASCMPSVSYIVYNKHKPTAQDSAVVIYKKRQEIPLNHKKIGNMNVCCIKGLSKNCDSLSIFRAAENKTKKIGGNALMIRKYSKPSLFNSRFLLKADIIKVLDFASLPNYLYSKRKTQISQGYGKGTWNLRLSLPYINHFLLKPDGEAISSSTGFLGISAGLDYFYKNAHYLSFSTGAVMDFFIPFPAPVLYADGEKQFSSASYIGLTDNYIYKYFSFGYGLSYSRNFWRYAYFGDHNNDGNYDDTPPSKKYFDNALGLMFTTYWVRRKNLNVGLIYKPSFIRLNTSPILKYEHLISLDFVWKIRLKTGKN